MSVRWYALCALVCISAACSTKTSVSPTVSVTTATLLSPANGASFANTQQPVTLTVTNATVTGTAASVTYTFEVASDATFTNVTTTRTVAAGSGQTSVTLDTLPGGKDYYWHVRVTADSAVGAFSSSMKFTVGAAIVVSAPTPVSPAAGATATKWPTLTVTNAARSGPVGTVVYQFDVATNSSFSPILASATVAEGSSQTTYTPTASNPTQTTVYLWRVTAIDQGSGTTSTATSTQAFTFNVITINAPSVVSPLTGVTVTTWPTLTVLNAARSGPVGAITYKFDLSSNSTFTAIVATATVSEGSTQTTYSPSPTTPSQVTVYYWRATATDQTSGTSSAASATQSFTFNPAFSSLWTGTQPPGTPGHATLGDNWQVQVLTSHGGVNFNSPPTEALQIFDLLDRGMTPQGALDWMHANGYPTDAAWFPGSQTIGLQYIYLALINGRWDLILRGE